VDQIAARVEQAIENTLGEQTLADLVLGAADTARANRPAEAVSIS